MVETLTVTEFPFDQVPQFSDRDIAYTLGHPSLRPFYQYPVELSAFAQVIKDKQQDPINRDLLAEVLLEQYQDLAPQDLSVEQIASLRSDKTFTVVTAHQPSLFTGPLYFIYKICSAIHLSRQLNKEYPDNHIVPVFVMGGEDHDFEEINHLHLFNKTIRWQNAENGATGRMGTQSLAPVLQEMQELLGESPQAQELSALLNEIFTKYSSYGQAMQALVHHFFGKEGLLVLSMDHPKLKRAFLPHLKKELFEQPSKGLVEKATEQLEAAGFSGQAFPRPINLFYLTDQARERLVQEGSRFVVLNTDHSFSMEEMTAELEAHPERFSPNVVLRPLFQEAILPNLAYIGGGGEIAYWLERKEQFAVFGLNFPMLIRRNSVLWIDKGSSKKMEKLHLSLNDLFVDTENLTKQFVKQQSEHELKFQEETKQLHALFAGIVEKVRAVDPTLVKTVKAEQANQMKSFKQLEGRILKAEKQRFEISLNQIRGLKDRLFPDNGLQERYDNFIGFYLKYGEDFFQTLLEILDPMKKALIIIQEQ